MSAAALPGEAHARKLRVLAVVTALLVPLPLAAASLAFLQKTAVAYFQKDDVDLMMKNARAVLDSPDTKAERAWSNERTGASGLARVKGAFTATDGAQCKRFGVVNRVKGVEDEATYTVCRSDQGGWRLKADAVPRS